MLLGGLRHWFFGPFEVPGAGETGAAAWVAGRAGSVATFSCDNAEWNDAARTRSVKVEAAATTLLLRRMPFKTFI
jgi:hypothetical protein